MHATAKPASNFPACYISIIQVYLPVTICLQDNPDVNNLAL